MILDPDALLAGPRGRRLCLAVLLAERDRPEVQDAAWAVSWAARPLAENRGAVVAVRGGAATFVEPDVSAAEAASALSRIRPRVDDAVLDAALTVAVDHAASWQPPSGEDVLAATDEVRAVLRPAARAIVQSTSAEWWAGPLDRTAQASVRWEGARVSTDPPRVTLSRWRGAMADDELLFATAYEARDVSGPWWSTPARDLPRSTRAREGGEPVGLTLVEDPLGWEWARVHRVSAPEGEVVEIDGPESWARLCRRHPLVVTASRRCVWEMATGRDGVWVQPDWAAVAAKAVGVHLTVAGYLTTAGRAIDLGDLGASVLAGWGPDETFWFDEVAESAPAEVWVVDRDRRWRRA